MNTNWKELIGDQLKRSGESWKDVESNTLSEEDMKIMFDDGFGGSAGKEFTLWTKNRVYFPAVYDGAEWAASVVRNPDGKPTAHIGGE